jgi:hypothetical protein
MSSDTATVPEPVSVTVPTAPAAAVVPEADALVVKTVEEIAGMYNVADWKKPVPTALAIFAHVSTMAALTGDQRIQAVQQVIIKIAKRAGTADEEKAAAFFANDVLPHVVHAMETLALGKVPAVAAVKEFAQKEMKGAVELVIPEVKKVSSWCWK